MRKEVRGKEVQEAGKESAEMGWVCGVKEKWNERKVERLVKEVAALTEEGRCRPGQRWQD